MLLLVPNLLVWHLVSRKNANNALNVNKKLVIIVGYSIKRHGSQGAELP